MHDAHMHYVCNHPRGDRGHLALVFTLFRTCFVLLLVCHATVQLRSECEIDPGMPTWTKNVQILLLQCGQVCVCTLSR